MNLGLALAAVSGFLVSTCFPPLQLSPLAWIALVPLLVAIDRESDPYKCTLFGAVFGFTFFAFDLRWMYFTLSVHGHFTPFYATAAYIGLMIILSFYTALLCFVIAQLRFKLGKESFLLFFPILWVAHEFLRANAFTGFPWNLLGYSQSENLNLIQIADITGVYGISFLVAAANSALYCVFQGVSKREFRVNTLVFPIIVSSLILAALIYGSWKVNHTSAIQSASTTRIGVLQGNIPQDLKWEETQRHLIFSRYENLASKAVQEGAKLVIWPETSVPVLFGSTDPDWTKVPDMSQRLRIPMMIGAPTVERNQTRVEYFNSAILLNGYDFLGKYDKVHLVPFGEYMPLSWILPLGPGIAAREIDFTQGKNMTVLPFNGLRFGTLICYEAIFPELARQAVANGANCLVNITNDGWFGNTAAPKQHLEMARFRSIENGLWLLRAANTGISAAFDQVGRIVYTIDLNSEGFFVGDVPLLPKPSTFYSRFGDVFAWMCIFLTFVTFGYAVSLKPRIQFRGLM